MGDFFARIERQYDKARRVWCMDRGVPTEAVLAHIRTSEPPVQYLVGTPKGRFTRLEQALLEKPWQAARPDVKVKLGELHVFAESVDRIAKKRALRRRQLKWLAVSATVQARNHGTDTRCLVDEARQCADAKNVIYCAPISWSPIQPSCGATTCNWCRWSKRLRRSKATCPFGRFTTKKSAASKPTF